MLYISVSQVASMFWDLYTSLCFNQWIVSGNSVVVVVQEKVSTFWRMTGKGKALFLLHQATAFSKLIEIIDKNTFTA